MARSAQQLRRAAGSDSVEQANAIGERSRVGHNHPLRWYRSHAFSQVKMESYSDDRCQFEPTQRLSSLARLCRGFLS